jgi:enamine deaminase RidA (YjgF/YER057c/UK114 family)
MSHVVRVRAPEGVAEAPGYSHTVWGTGRLVAIAGQVALDEQRQLVGPGDPAAQARQVFENLRRCLAAAGATFADVIKLNYYVVDIGHLPAVRAARDELIPADQLPASTAVQVAALFAPEFLMEIEAWTIVPENRA